MTVNIQYVVVRDGVEKMTFASKKEADAYDKMLNLADNLNEWLTQAPLTLEEGQREALSFYLAEQKDSLGRLLRGASLASLVDVSSTELVSEESVGESDAIEKAQAA
ncbi:YebG family protein [Edwardsiella ictaluri]|uniref:YebG family protein n=1 Tax=Edwardsiella ictaluri TaxID=67780 RepID=A0ABY8GFL8_EDWIC|nr:YebG family protein [Edwardsiella ictaluri]ELV7529254.1 YebG family protein [Edwardsiella ictaluri]KMQ77132.1 hypothetical protein ABY58_16305 [Edwardsiella ictaluri]KOO54051.1 hypothetical protein ACS33_16415 [Edwardsiella ictaluri]WFN96253.1 YebG family protein [Edwardsiella ictaluri]